MPGYRIYIDETGTHDLRSVDNPNERFLALTGVIFDSEHYGSVVQVQMAEMKLQYFQIDPDTPLIFHRKEMVNKRPPFQSLWDKEINNKFNNSLLEALKNWQYTVITIVIDKKEHRDRYKVWKYHPYHYCLMVLLERYVQFLDRNNGVGDVMVEMRGGLEDQKLKESYKRLFEEGTDHISMGLWQKVLTSRKLKVKPKKANITGLQVADLIAHPSRREILQDHNLISDNRIVFGDKICKILRDEKYYRNAKSGIIKGYGKKLLP